MLEPLRKRLTKSQKKFIRGLLYLPNMPFDFIYCSLKRLHWKQNWRFYGFPVVQNKGVINIGNNFVAVSSQKHNSLGIIQPVILKTSCKNAIISIGNDVGLSGCTLSATESIFVGNEVLVGSGSLITDNDAHPICPHGRRYSPEKESKPVIIYNNVFIGARVIILKGVQIGEGSVIGAGSVVTRDVPPYSIAAGNPAEVIGDLTKFKKNAE
jgi:acetyltransferase-like isoleucine patch superfamily enzyme